MEMGKGKVKGNCPHSRSPRPREAAEKIRPAATRTWLQEAAPITPLYAPLFFSMENLMHLPLLTSSAKRLVISVIFFLVFTPPAVLAQARQSAQAPQPIEAIMKNMVSAILANSLADFVSPGDEAFQAGMTKEMLSSINQSLASRLKQGYTTTFLTTLHQQGFDVYVWKVVQGRE